MKDIIEFIEIAIVIILIAKFISWCFTDTL